MQQLKIHFTPIDSVYGCQTISMLNNLQYNLNNVDAVLDVAKRLYRLQNRCIQNNLINNVSCSEEEFANLIQQDYKAVHTWTEHVVARLFDYETRQTS